MSRNFESSERADSGLFRRGSESSGIESQVATVTGFESSDHEPPPAAGLRGESVARLNVTEFAARLHDGE